MCTEFNLKIDESTELLLLSDTIKQSCFEFLFSSHIECCPYCGSIHIVKAGKNSEGRHVINAIIVNEDSLIVQII